VAVTDIAEGARRRSPVTRVAADVDSLSPEPLSSRSV